MFESKVELYVYEVTMVTMKITKRQVKSVAIDIIDVNCPFPHFVNISRNSRTFSLL